MQTHWCECLPAPGFLADCRARMLQRVIFSRLLEFRWSPLNGPVRVGLGGSE
jgi:hypothetical protein